MSGVKEAVSKNIFFYRKRNKFTQKQLAKMLGVANTTISGWEIGASSIDIDNLFKICKIYGISVNDMYGKYKTIDSLYTEKERLLIEQYRHHKDLNKAIDKILDLENTI